jgi:hypothetical protein
MGQLTNLGQRTTGRKGPPRHLSEVYSGHIDDGYTRNVGYNSKLAPLSASSLPRGL